MCGVRVFLLFGFVVGVNSFVEFVVGVVRVVRIVFVRFVVIFGVCIF